MLATIHDSEKSTGLHTITINCTDGLQMTAATPSNLVTEGGTNYVNTSTAVPAKVTTLGKTMINLSPATD